MFKPAALFIGWRYTAAKRQNHFISLISLISMLGIALGVLVLITILSVLNGFDREIKKQLFGWVPAITISSYVGHLDDWQTWDKSLHAFPDMTGAAPLVSGQAFLTNADRIEPVWVTGILPEREKKMSVLSHALIKGELSDLKAGGYDIIIGDKLAAQLGVTTGDTITIATANGSLITADFKPRYHQFIVSGIFHTGGGGFRFDTETAFIHLKDAQSLFNMGTAVTALHLNMKNIYAAPLAAQQLQEQFPTVRVSDWTEQLGGFFDNIRLTKTLMFFIFVLIIAVAVFNLICSMVMIVKNKQADIAILRTLGATPADILIIFVVQGAIIGLGGTIIGTFGGIALAHYIPALSNWIQQVFHVQLISADIYFVNYLPSELQWPDVLLICAVALALSLTATLYPAWNASQIEPVESLKSE